MPNWQNAKPDVVEKIVQEGETYLQGQLTLATSADQRASSLAGIFAASGTALIVALVATISVNDLPPSLFVGGFVSALMFLVAAGLCLLTALPLGFYLPGNEPENWYEDVDGGKELIDALAQESENYQEKITDNRKTLQKNARLFRLGAIMGIIAPLVGVCLWAIGLLFCNS